MKRRILLVDDDLAVLLTLKAVLELHEFEVEIAQSTDEAFRRLDAGIYHMVISDLRMETEEAGLEVIRAAHRQSYAPATALLTAFPPSEELTNGLRSAGQPDSLLVKPIGTRDLVRQIEAMLIRHADQRETHRRLRDAPTPVPKRSAG
ncbi:MAG: response regulator [Terriglobales bacterium]